MVNGFISLVRVEKMDLNQGYHQIRHARDKGDDDSKLIG